MNPGVQKPHCEALYSAKRSAEEDQVEPGHAQPIADVVVCMLHVLQ